MLQIYPIIVIWVKIPPSEFWKCSVIIQGALPCMSPPTILTLFVLNDVLWINKNKLIVELILLECFTRQKNHLIRL